MKSCTLNLLLDVMMNYNKKKYKHKKSSHCSRKSDCKICSSHLLCKHNIFKRKCKKCYK